MGAHAHKDFSVRSKKYKDKAIFRGFPLSTRSCLMACSQRSSEGPQRAGRGSPGGCGGWGSARAPPPLPR
eukprot:scaffold88030_cov30-Tisochrysis_lutea.AAC.2